MIYTPYIHVGGGDDDDDPPEGLGRGLLLLLILAYPYEYLIEPYSNSLLLWSIKTRGGDAILFVAFIVFYFFPVFLCLFAGMAHAEWMKNRKGRRESLGKK